jgi:hypothetical protein
LAGRRLASRDKLVERDREVFTSIVYESRFFACLYRLEITAFVILVTATYNGIENQHCRKSKLPQSGVILKKNMEEQLEEIKQRLARIENAIAQFQEPENAEYATMAEAANIFGYKSVNPMYDLIANGTLRVGKEVEDRRSQGSSQPHYFVDIVAAKKRFRTLPSKRKN